MNSASDSVLLFFMQAPRSLSLPKYWADQTLFCSCVQNQRKQRESECEHEQSTLNVILRLISWKLYRKQTHSGKKWPIFLYNALKSRIRFGLIFLWKFSLGLSCYRRHRKESPSALRHTVRKIPRVFFERPTFLSNRGFISADWSAFRTLIFGPRFAADRNPVVLFFQFVVCSFLIRLVRGGLASQRAATPFSGASGVVSS